jgi:hypothetical protein
MQSYFFHRGVRGDLGGYRKALGEELVGLGFISTPSYLLTSDDTLDKVDFALQASTRQIQETRRPSWPPFLDSAAGGRSIAGIRTSISRKESALRVARGN